ncbi:MAG TPA: deoxyribonuclease IV [Thermodesulfobacteriota bacterium]|nr:deoxyribonuclease IV [Thermodesulfobacteriota bacterium]
MTASLLRLGVHIPIAGGFDKALHRAKELGCSALQMFSRNPRGWRVSGLDPSVVRVFRKGTAELDIDPVVIHTPYLVNLATPEEPLRTNSVAAVVEDLGRAEELGAAAVVTHVGSGRESPAASARGRVVSAVREILDRGLTVRLLLENSSGAGNTVGSSLEELGEILEGVEGDPRIGFCFDACHGFAAGYDFRTAETARLLLRTIEATIGMERLFLMHLNDSAGSLGSRLDRHQHIGKGNIGMEGFRSLLSEDAFRKVPMILETPKDRPRDDEENLERIRGIYESTGPKRSQPRGPRGFRGRHGGK